MLFLAEMDRSRVEVKAGKTSPIINRSFKLQTAIFPRKHYLVWALGNLLMAVIVYFEYVYQYVMCWIGINGNLMDNCLTVIACILLINTVINVVHAVSYSTAPGAGPLSPKQKDLMGLRCDTSHFETPVQDVSSHSHRSPSLAFNLSNLTSKSSSSLVRTERNRLSFTYGSPSSSFDGSFSSFSSQAHSFLTKRSSPYQVSKSFFNSSDDGGIISPSFRSPLYNAPLPEEEFMTQQETLNRYLKFRFETLQDKLNLYGRDFPSYQGADYGDLSKTAYMLATRPLKSPTSKSKDSKDDLVKVAADEYWLQAGVSESCLREWMAKLRRWMSVVVLRGIVKEIDEVNVLLKHHGFSEVQIGESSLHSLKQVHVSKGSALVRLACLLPILELTVHQEYLVERIRALAACGYLSSFCWNKGGSTKNRKDWGDDLVTDCELIAHIFCMYMDIHLPPDSRFPDGKAFSSQYFVKAPAKPKTAKIDDKMVLYQSQLHPPHFMVVSKEVTYDLPAGRHNLFSTLLLFLHYLKVKKSCMLGQVNLGLIGIDLLYVIDPIPEDMNFKI